MSKVILFIMASAFVFVLAGCNTVGGVGKDIKKGGEAIEKAAEKSR